MKRAIGAAGVVLLVALVAGVAWAAWTMRAAEQHLQAAQVHLLDARSAIAALDATAATASVDAAKVESSAAADLAGRPVWAAAAAMPRLGDTPRAARSLVLAADAATSAVGGLAAAAGDLDSGALFADGRVDLAAVAAAGAAATTAQSALSEASGHLAAMPSAASGAWVLAPVEEARVELAAQVEELVSATSALEQVGALVPGLLGADGPKEYFVGVQAPNETRGTGGLVGTWAVLRADDGALSVAALGSNDETLTLDAMPAWVDEQYLARYGEDPRIFVNSNVSPDFPVAAQLWLSTWQQATGQQLDGALGIDVTAIGDLLTAAGTTLTAPDGMTLSGEQFADFALTGIYEKFPTAADSAARNAYQEALAQQTLAAVLAAGDPVPLARALAEQVGERRVAAWVRDPALQAQVAESGIAHSLRPGAAHSVEPVLINVGWSKLDTYLERSFDYVVGRCVDASGSVRSTLTMRITSDLPQGDLPEYVVGAVPVGPTGPINRLILQAHLPPGAEVLDVEIDGEGSEFGTFEEAGRPAFAVNLDLPPRVPREVVVTFLEPADAVTGEVLVQPMARAAQVTIGDRTC